VTEHGQYNIVTWPFTLRPLVNHIRGVDVFTSNSVTRMLYRFRKRIKKFNVLLTVHRITVDPRVTTGLTYEQIGLRPKF
jgi:hypothetical protein